MSGLGQSFALRKMLVRISAQPLFPYSGGEMVKPVTMQLVLPSHLDKIKYLILSMTVYVRMFAFKFKVCMLAYMYV